MIGNDQVRFCEHCSLAVKDLSQLTRKRALRLVTSSRGRLCVRYHRRPDGSLVTKSVPQKFYSIGRRASRIAAGAFSATLSLTSAVAQSSPTEQSGTNYSISAPQEAVRVQITAGADMNTRNRDGKTALTYARENDHGRLVKLLQSYGAFEGDPAKDIALRGSRADTLICFYTCGKSGANLSALNRYHFQEEFHGRR